jgi:hypothetical protein
MRMFSRGNNAPAATPRPWPVTMIPFAKRPKRLPVVPAAIQWINSIRGPVLFGRQGVRSGRCSLTCEPNQSRTGPSINA